MPFKKGLKVIEPTEDEIEELGAPILDNTKMLTEAFTAALNARDSSDVDKEKKFLELINEGRDKPKENRVAPGVSAFNPDGERDNPRPHLKCKHVWQCGFPVIQKASTKEELELINLLIDEVNRCRREHIPLKEYMVSKADGRQARVTLEADYNATTDMVENLHINYPVRDQDMRSGLYSFTLMLQEMLGLAMPDVDTNALLARNRALESELQQLKLAVQ